METARGQRWEEQFEPQPGDLYKHKETGVVMRVLRREKRSTIFEEVGGTVRSRLTRTVTKQYQFIRPGPEPQSDAEALHDGEPE